MKSLSLRKYVRIKKNKDNKALQETGLEWVKTSAANRLSYEIDWLGIPVIQTPEDLVLMQELIYEVQPDIIIETGIAHGGSLIYYASLMELIGKGKVIGIDIDIRSHNRTVIESHPMYKRIEMIQGSSVSRETVDKLRAMIPSNAEVIVCLDSDHTRQHVYQELTLYAQFIKPGGYIVVFDTNTSQLAELGIFNEIYVNNSPKEAIEDFFKHTDDFVIDRRYNKLFISYSPNGYLKRVK
ncbi:MAG: cephalosporin hydroxylase family protein [Spirochaetes bacterium]|nr:cephalosporin hydroxylase family protein [Spirochaetota bacterium]